MVKVYLSFLSVSLILVSCGTVLPVSVNAPNTVSPEASSTTPSPESSPESTRLSGQTIATIAHRDLAHPALSPDGRILAYSEVLVENGAENTAVQLYDLQSGQVTTLLDQEKARQFKTYSVYVSRMTWQQADRLEVMVSDGDVDSTRLMFNPQTGELIEQEAIEPGMLSEADQAQHRQILALFPELKPEDLGRFSNNFVVAKDGILWAGALPSRGKNIWFLNFKTRSIDPLFSANDSRIESSLVNGFNVGDTTVFSLTQESASFLMSYKDGVTQPLTRIDSSNASIKSVYQSANRAVFMLKIYASYEEGDNPLFLFEGDRLTRISEYEQLYDAAVDAQGNRIAYCYWIDGKRQIEVKELK
jgi:hypothetical protein